MKKVLLLISSMFIAFVTQAQVSNGSFENWYSDTASFDFAPFIPLDTFYFTSPVDWTCSNSITMSAGLHHSQFADSSAQAFAGNKALYLRTDTIYIDAASLNLVIPGFVINGNFRLHLSDVLGSGGLNPVAIQGAGVPLSVKKKGFGFHFKYLPIPNDSCLIWAILKKGTQVVAEAKFNSSQTYSNYTYISKDFTYYNCIDPDTLIIFISSSNPNFSTIGSGTTGLNRGSEMYIDSVELIDFPMGHNFPPIATNDIVYTTWNTVKTIAELANDSDCENDSLTVSITNTPLHGSAVLNASHEIVYTPNTNYSGKDSLHYSLSDGHSVSQASVVINIFSTSAVEELTDDDFSIYPNPARESVIMKSISGAPFNVELLSINGSVIDEWNNLQGGINVNIGNLANGIYLLRFSSPQKTNMLTKRISVLH